MTSNKKIEELTMDEIKEQLALYQRLYYKKKIEDDPEYLIRKRERQRKQYREKKEREGGEKKTPKNDYNRKYFGDNYMLVSAS